MNDRHNDRPDARPGDPLRQAVRSALGDIVSNAPEATDIPVRSLDLHRVEAQARSRRPYLAAAAAVVVLAGIGGAVAVANRSASKSTVAPASETDTTLPALWPVQLAAGLAPWYEANDAITAALGDPQVGPAQARVQCTQWSVAAGVVKQWTAAAGVVKCAALTGEGYLPAVGYASGARYVDISTLHSNIGITAYANNYSHGKDVGYDSAALPLQVVTVAGKPGKLVEAPNGTTRVTFEPVPGTLVAVEVGGGLTRDDLLTVAAGVRPTTSTPTIPLVIAQSAPDADGLRVTALGGVKGGELCLLTDAGCTTLGDQPVRAQASTLGKQGLVGIAASRVAALGITSADSTTVDMPLADPPVGTTRAFAIVLQPGSSVLPLDATGSPIPLVNGSAVTVPLTMPSKGNEVTATTSRIDSATNDSVPNPNGVSPVTYADGSPVPTTSRIP